MGSGKPSNATPRLRSESSETREVRRPDTWDFLNDPWLPDGRVIRAVCAVFAIFMLLLALFREDAGQPVLIGRLIFVAYGAVGALLATRFSAIMLRFYVSVLAIVLPFFALYVSLESGGTPITLSFIVLAIVCSMVFILTIIDLIAVVVALFIGHGVCLALFTEPVFGLSNQWLLWTSAVSVAAMTSVSLLIYRLRLRDSERMLLRARDEALEASQAKSELLANMSDEIRTPLNGIVGLVDLLLDTKLSTEQRRYLEMVGSDSERLMLLLNDLLDLSKMHAHRLELEIETFNLPDTLRATLTPKALRAEEKGVELFWETSNRLPVWVKGDPHRLRQVLANLVDNAIRFTDEGEISIIVNRAPRREGREHVEFTIRDTGIGMAEDELSSVLDSFADVDSSAIITPQGSGLGLAVCAQLVELMQGRIEAESSQGRGSEFKFTARLPADRVKEQEWANKSSRRRQGGAIQVSVLLVEDNATNRIFAERVLQKAGHSVVTAENGQVALDKFDEHDFDIVFMDMQMPVMDGLQAAKAIRRKERGTDAHVPIVALTAHVLEEQKQRCLDAGMDMHLGKPIHGAALLDVIYQMVDLADEDEPPQRPSKPPARESTPFIPRKVAAAAPSQPSAEPAEPEPPADEPEGIVFDVDRLLDMLDGDRELIADMLSEFDDQQQEIMNDLQRALDDDDSDRGGKLAHKLKGSLLALCADVSADTAKTMEHALRDGDLATGRENYPLLKKQLGDLMDELRRQKFVR